MELDFGGNFDFFLSCVRLSVLYIETNGVVEKHSVLRHDADVASKALKPKSPYIRTEE